MAAPHILAIETSTPTGSVAVACAGDIVYTESFASARNHNAKLFDPLRRALDHCGDAPSHLLVGCGPGSYNGARVAIAAAQGIALVHGCEVVSLPSYLGLDAVRSGHAVMIAGNARRGEFSVQYAKHRQLEGEPKLLQPADFATAIDGAGTTQIVTIDRSDDLGVVGVSPANIEQVAPQAQHLISAWLEADGAQRSQWMERQPEPFYLRPPHITPAKKRQLPSK